MLFCLYFVYSNFNVLDIKYMFYVHFNGLGIWSYVCWAQFWLSTDGKIAGSLPSFLYWDQLPLCVCVFLFSFSHFYCTITLILIALINWYTGGKHTPESGWHYCRLLWWWCLCKSSAFLKGSKGNSNFALLRWRWSCKPSRK